MALTSKTTPKPSTQMTRRTVLAGAAATAAATGLAVGLPGSAGAATLNAYATGAPLGGQTHSSLCAAHHQELASHLRQVLNSSYVDATMKNKVLSTAHCPHCKTGIGPDMLAKADRDKAAFAVIA